MVWSRGLALVPRMGNVTAQRLFQHQTVVSGPPRNKVSKVEKAVLGMLLGLGATAGPLWVLYNIPEYKKKDDE